MVDFILTWVEKEQGFPHEEIARMINLLNENGHVDEPWRFQSTKARINNRVWLLKQGDDPRGIFGVGHFVGPRVMGPASNGKMSPMALVRFTTLVDPKEEFLIGWSSAKEILNMRIYASGTLIDDDRAKALESLLPSRSSN